MWEVVSNIFGNIFEFLDVNAVWVLFAWIFYIGSKKNFSWVTSIRSLLTMFIGFAFVDLATDSKIDPKDFMLIVSLVFNFYFLVKQRTNGETHDQDRTGK